MAIRKRFRTTAQSVKVHGPKRIYVRDTEEFHLPECCQYGNGINPQIWINFLTQKVNKLKKSKYKKIVVKQGYGASLDFFEFERLENDQEYQRRMDKELALKGFELEQLKRLKLKYGQ